MNKIRAALSLMCVPAMFYLVIATGISFYRGEDVLPFLGWALALDFLFIICAYGKQDGRKR